MNKTKIKKLLEEAAPIEIWEHAIKQAKRSTFKRHRTGAVIFDKHGPIEWGCSYKGINGHVSSVHAEVDALRRAKHFLSGGESIVIVTLTKPGNFALTSKPCFTCASQLEGMHDIIYVERQNDGVWAVNVEHSIALLERSSMSAHMKYAREMRL